MSPVDLGRMPRPFAQLVRVYHNELARVRRLLQQQEEARKQARELARMVRHG